MQLILSHLEDMERIQHPNFFCPHFFRLYSTSSNPIFLPEIGKVQRILFQQVAVACRSQNI